MPQFKECTVDELLRDSLIELSLKHNNKKLFELLTGEDWRNYIVNKECIEEIPKQNEQLHNNNFKLEEAKIFDDYILYKPVIIDSTINKNKNKYNGIVVKYDPTTHEWIFINENE